jgi:hypothetical protein
MPLVENNTPIGIDRFHPIKMFASTNTLFKASINKWQVRYARKLRAKNLTRDAFKKVLVQKANPPLVMNFFRKPSWKRAVEFTKQLDMEKGRDAFGNYKKKLANKIKV